MPEGRLREVRHVHCEEENAAKLEDFIKGLRVDGRQEHTVTAYRFAVKDFLGFICGLDVGEVSHREVREWLHWMHVQGSSPSTIASRKYALSSFFTFLQENYGGQKRADSSHSEPTCSKALTTLALGRRTAKADRCDGQSTGPRACRVHVGYGMSCE